MNGSDSHPLAMIFTLGITLLLMLIIIPQTEGCTWYTIANKDVDEGEVAYYYIRATNNDHPFGVYVRFEIDQDNSTYQARNTEFYLNPGDQDSIHIYVYTDNVGSNRIWTNVTYYERDALEDQYREDGASYIQTRIHNQTVTESREHVDRDSGNIFLGVVAVTGFGIVFSYLLSRGGFPVPVIRAYTRLKKDRILENRVRKSIWELLHEYPDGLKVSEIQQTLDIEHKRLVEYHLGKLMEFDHARKVDSLYYPAGVRMRKPFIQQIRMAMGQGARTPEEIATRIGSYRQKVRYHMKKHEMW